MSYFWPPDVTKEDYVKMLWIHEHSVDTRTQSFRKLHLAITTYLNLHMTQSENIFFFPLQHVLLSALPSLRTLLLHNSNLRLLSGDLLSWLPSLEELSLHSNPLRCDCLSSWGRYLGNHSHVKLLESSITTCSTPQSLIGRELQELVAWGGGAANSCLPLISPHSFPSVMNVSTGQPIRLECWADADPVSQYYWVTPAGDKVGVIPCDVCRC